MNKLPVSIRFSEMEDEKKLIEWLLQPNVLKWFPLSNHREITDAARIWMSYSQQQGALTALIDGKPCGIATLYLNPFRKLAHQCLLAILVDEKYRNRGVGRCLMEKMEALARDHFSVRLLHLEVYEGNPAIRLYERMGFIQYGYQKQFIKESDGNYLGKIMMQKKLV